MLFPVLHGFLLLLSTSLSSASDFRIASRDTSGVSRAIFEQLFKDVTENQQRPKDQPVLVTEPADPEVGVSSDPFANMRAISGVNSPTKIDKTALATSDFMFYNRLPDGRDGFEMANSSKKKDLVILLATHGSIVITLSSSLMNDVFRQTGKSTKPPSQIAAMPKFDYFISHLILGEQTEQEQPSTFKLNALVKNPPKDNLKKFTDEMKRQNGTPLRLATVTRPKKVPGGQADSAVFEAVVWKIKQLVDPNLPTVPLKMATGTSPKAEELGISTYRGLFDGQNAQYVSVIYGDRGGVSAMIPISSNVAEECETGLQTIILDGYDPSITQRKFAEYPESWFNFQLDTAPKEGFVVVQAIENKPYTFLVVTDQQFWLLAVPPFYLRNNDVIPSRKEGTLEEKRSGFLRFAEKYLDHGFSDFVENQMDETEKIVAYVGLARVRVQKQGEYTMSYRSFFAKVWNKIDQLAQGKKQSGIDGVQFMATGRSLNPRDTKFGIALSSEGDVEIEYTQKTQLTIQVEPLSSSPNIDDDDGDSTLMKLTKIAKDANDEGGD